MLPGLPMSESLTGVIVLAAGRGTRMKSALPKVLHPVCGRPMVSHIVRAALAVEPARVAVVVGFGGDQVRAALAAEPVEFVDQPEQLGTADAVARCRDSMAGCNQVMVLNGDSPLVTRDLLIRLLVARAGAPLAFLSCRVEDPGNLGRVERDSDGNVGRVV